MDLYSDILSLISPLLLIIGILLGFYYYRFIDRENRLIWLYLFVCVFFDIVSRNIDTETGNNLFLWPLFSLSELLVFSKFYQVFIKKNKIIYSLLALGIGYILFEIGSIDSTNVKGFQSYARIVTSFLIVIMVLSKIIWQVQTNQNISLSKQYLNNMILIVFSLNVLLLLPINLLVNGSSLLITTIWMIYLSLTVVFYIYLSYSIWKNGKNRKRLLYGS